MFDPRGTTAARAARAGADEVAEGLLDHLHMRDTTLAYVSRAPLEKIERYKAKKGWDFPWYSSYGSDFNYDFHVTLDEAVAPVEYNFRGADGAAGTRSSRAEPFEMPGTSCFLRDERPGVPHLLASTPAAPSGPAAPTPSSTSRRSGRQEDWEEPKGRSESARGGTAGLRDLVDDDYEHVEVRSRAEWRAWLAEHHGSRPGVWVVTFKKHTGDKHVPYGEVVEEALAFGWIDSLGRRVDEDRFRLRLSPRKPRSKWSAPNKERIERLEASGAMAPPGAAVIAAAKADGSWDK